MPALNEPGGRGANFAAGLVLVLSGAGFAIIGTVQVFTGAFATGVGYLAIGGIMLVMARRGHDNFRQYLDERKRTGTPEQ